MNSTKNLELSTIAKKLRKLVVSQVFYAQSGHIGGSLSATEILTYLYFEYLNVNPNQVKMESRDRFVLSKGHCSPILYACLAEKGFIDEALLKTFRHTDSILEGHPNMRYIAGVEMSTGSLGQGFSAAVGMAIASKLDGLQNKVVALLGDGEVQEGQIWEASMSSAHYKLDNLVAILDLNGLQIDGEVKEIMQIQPIDQKFEAFGWHVLVIDGHDFDQIRAAFAEADQIKGKPTMIIAKTVKGKGVSFMENQVGWHGVAPNQEQFDLAMAELNDEGQGGKHE